MRKINKGTAMDAFSRFVCEHHPRCWEDALGESWAWRRHILENEQNGLGGYTEVCLPDLDKVHIDHFRKRALFQDLVFAWDNLVVDSKDDTFGARYKDDHIGNVEENERLIDPVREDAARYFRYEVTGKMIPANGLADEDRQRAQFTIDMFNLNESSLQERRKLILCVDMNAFAGLDDDVIRQSLSSRGFPSVVEQVLAERKKNVI